VRNVASRHQRSSLARGLIVAVLAVAGALGGGGSAASAVAVVHASSSRAGLPDGRAWEMVSPPDKNGGDILGLDGTGVSGVFQGGSNGGVVQASPDGNRITYVSLSSFAGPQGAPPGSQYVSEWREDGRWSTTNITLPSSAQAYSFLGAGMPYSAFSTDISSGLVLNGVGGYRVGHPVETPPLAGAPAGYQNYYLYKIPGGELQALLAGPPTQPLPPQLPSEFNLEFLGATPDLNHVVVSSRAALTEGAVEGEEKSNLYEWDSAGEHARLQPIDISPTGVPEPHQPIYLGSGHGESHTISADGSRVLWSYNGDLYVREKIGTEQARTVQVDAARGGPESGGGRFQTANGEDSKIFFADNGSLTSESTASHRGQGNLYEFEPETETLTDLTVDRADASGAEVQGMLGASEDGSYVYFVANGAFVPGVSPGNCVIGPPLAGATCNLYLWHDGEIRYIATLSNEDESGSTFPVLGVAFDWSSETAYRTARVTPDGSRLVFMSNMSLTGYDNTVASGESCGTEAAGNPLPAQCEEVFVYDANANRVSCVSCNPSGARPGGPSGIPGGTNFALNDAQYQSRALTDDGGRVFFESDDALVPQDTNGTRDVYEYEGGQAYLISDGKSTGGAAFVDASANGDDVFFITGAQLVGQDADQLVDLYDAREPYIAGEEVAVPVVPPVAPCEGEGCRPSGASAPALAAPSSATFAGAGNVAPSPSTMQHKSKRKIKPKAKRKKARRGKRARAGVNRKATGRGR
jgi:hypothetical protein